MFLQISDTWGWNEINLKSKSVGKDFRILDMFMSCMSVLIRVWSSHFVTEIVCIKEISPQLWSETDMSTFKAILALAYFKYYA
jgi:hypothetical protein